MRLVPYTVAGLPSRFSIIILVGIRVRAVRTLKKQGQTTHYILKLHKLTHIDSICALKWICGGTVGRTLPVQSLK